MSEPLWTLSDVLAATGGEASGALPATASGVSIDSRTLEPGDLFFAISDRTDGHAYVDSALGKGAAAAVVAHSYESSAGPLIRVDDPLEALNKLGAAARQRSAAKIVAVTGSVGKTSTKEMLRTVFSASGATHASEKSYNNLWGVPLSLARMPQAARTGVFEIGMNHAGEITPLTQLAQPHIAIVTTIAPVHLEFFASTAAIAEAKAEIFSGLEPGGAAIINRDTEHFPLLEQRAKAAGATTIVSFGEDAAANVRLTAVTLDSDTSTVTAQAFGETLRYTISAPGRHLVLNSLAVLAALKLTGASLHTIEALASYAVPEGRGVRETFPFAGGEVLVIDESYNANPASVAAAIAVLGSLPRARHARRVAVLGDMLELGHASAELHTKLSSPIDEAGVDVVFACGPQMRNLYEALPRAKRGAYAENSAALQEALLAAIQPGDAVMIKGSLGSRMGPLAGLLKQHLRNG